VICFRGEEAGLRDAYTARQKSSHVRIKDDEDGLIWSMNHTGIYTPKVGYKLIKF